MSVWITDAPASKFSLRRTEKSVELGQCDWFAAHTGKLAHGERGPSEFVSCPLQLIPIPSSAYQNSTLAFSPYSH